MRGDQEPADLVVHQLVIHAVKVFEASADEAAAWASVAAASHVASCVELKWCHCGDLYGEGRTLRPCSASTSAISSRVSGDHSLSGFQK